MPILPTFEDIDSRPTGNGSRVYDVARGVRLHAFHVESRLPFAPHGFIVYVFVEGDIVGNWDWTDDAEAIGRIIRTFRETTSPSYEPPDHRAPDGDVPNIRPPMQDLLARVMAESRPGALHAPPSSVIGERIVIPFDRLKG